VALCVVLCCAVNKVDGVEELIDDEYVAKVVDKEFKTGVQ